MSVPFPILILAAGASTRMRGRDKLLEQVRGRALLADRIEAARAASKQVFVTLPPAPHPRYAVAGGAQPIPVPDARSGMGASLRAGIRALPANTSHVMVLLADMPDLTTADLCAVAQGGQGLAWRGATQEGLPGHPIVFAAPLFTDLCALSGDSGGRSVLDALTSVPLIRLAGERARTDLDTPDAWKRWRQAQNTE